MVDKVVTALVAGDADAADFDGWSDDAVAEGEVVADHLDPEKQLLEFARHGDFLRMRTPDEDYNRD